MTNDYDFRKKLAKLGYKDDVIEPMSKIFANLANKADRYYVQRGEFLRRHMLTRGYYAQLRKYIPPHTDMDQILEAIGFMVYMDQKSAGYVITPQMLRDDSYRNLAGMIEEQSMEQT